jgi:hypothetical protein
MAVSVIWSKSGQHLVDYENIDGIIVYHTHCRSKHAAMRCCLSNIPWPSFTKRTFSLRSSHARIRTGATCQGKCRGAPLR